MWFDGKEKHKDWSMLHYLTENAHQKGINKSPNVLVQNAITLGTGGGLVLHALVRSLHKKLTNESIWGLDV